jgi:hypothetical protein
VQFEQIWKSKIKNKVFLSISLVNAVNLKNKLYISDSLM